METEYLEMEFDNFEQVRRDVARSQFMKLDKKDYTFMSIVVGLQLVRQFLSEKLLVDRKQYNDQELAHKIKQNDLLTNHVKPNAYGEWILGPTCYDAIARTPGMKRIHDETGISGTNHRYKTLAHDPLIGLLVGPLNILSESLTRNDLKNYHTRPNDAMNPMTGYQIASQEPIIFSVGKALETVQNDPKILPAAVLKHLIHIATDVATIQGLTLPAGTALLPDNVNKWLLANRFDFLWFGNVVAQTGLSSFINSISSVTYKWIFCRDSTIDNEWADAKVKKIIAIANAISASGNLARVGMDILLGQYVQAVRHTDFGGLIVAIHAILSSSEFLNELKSITHAWDDIEFGLTTSAEAIQKQHRVKLTTINQRFAMILQEIEQQYETFTQVQNLAVNWQLPAHEQFQHSQEFATLNHVESNKILKSKRDIDQFFNN